MQCLPLGRIVVLGSLVFVQLKRKRKTVVAPAYHIDLLLHVSPPALRVRDAGPIIGR